MAYSKQKCDDIFLFCFRLYLLFIFSCCIPASVFAKVEFSQRFAPHQGIVTEYEQPQRKEFCLNGKWRFQPVDIPEDFQWGNGVPPELSEPAADKWSETAIKIPSAWNVNNWGLWAEPGIYDPVPLYYPSYPDSWKNYRMGWLNKSFQVPDDWLGRRLILRFNAVAGQCRVLVNGKTVIESHYDSFTPFEADITDCVDFSGDNDLLVGVRSHGLFRKEHPDYKWGWDAMGPRGSDMYDLCGVYRDVYLLGLPPVYTEDVFVKPRVDRDELEVDVTIRNTSNERGKFGISGVVRPWKNLSDTDDVISAPEEKWTLESSVMRFSQKEIKLNGGEAGTVTLSEAVEGRLAKWSPDNPELYGLLLTVKSADKTIDRKYTRFGWRQFEIENGDLFLNGEKIQLYGDILHPFSAFIMSRRTAWAWYNMIKDFGGNAVRPHAQPWPDFYIEMADEMGIVVLDETGIFGSAGGFNMDEQRAWENCKDEYRALIRRDRNNPSVMGWSFANEMFALRRLNNISDEEFEVYRDKLADLGRIAYELDPTREWISCDGDEDLDGRLPVWSKHWGDGWMDKKGVHYNLSEDESKPWMLGEYSGSYYGTPDRLDYLNGDRAYKSYTGRAEALGIDIYELATDIARDKLDYFSASETVWFGLEHLNLGYDDFTRLPTAQDGVFFTRPYQEGVPGMQPERIPPFVTTLNPGWDPNLPLYKPLDMFKAMKAALAPGEPESFKGRIPFTERPDVPQPDIDSVRFVGGNQGKLYGFLENYNLPVTNSPDAEFVIIDAHTGLHETAAESLIESVLSEGGTAVIMLRNDDVDSEMLNSVLPEPIVLTDRRISSFVHGKDDGLTAPFSLDELYFVDKNQQKYTMQCGLGGEFVEKSKVLLKACNTDWSLFNAPENRKCGALVLYEKLRKPSGAALVEWTNGEGKLLVCSIGISGEDERLNHFWGKLFACLGINTENRADSEDPELQDSESHDLLRDGPLE